MRGTKAVNLTGVSGTFTGDEEINQATTGAVGKVVEWDSVNNILYYIQTRHTDEGIDSNGNLTAFSGTNVITGQSSSVQEHQQLQLVQLINQSFTSGYSGSRNRQRLW